MRDVPASQYESALSEQQKSSASPSAVRRCPLCWVEIQVLDEEDQPVADEAYWIRLPDGSIREGRLDNNGLVRFDGIACGTCLVKLPRYDVQEIESKSQKEPDQTDWIELLLQDEKGQPVPDEPFSVALPNGRVIEGSLDKKGHARVEGIPAGMCTVQFLNLDCGDFA